MACQSRPEGVVVVPESEPEEPELLFVPPPVLPVLPELPVLLPPVLPALLLVSVFVLLPELLLFLSPVLSAVWLPVKNYLNAVSHPVHPVCFPALQELLLTYYHPYRHSYHCSS